MTPQSLSSIICKLHSTDNKLTCNSVSKAWPMMTKTTSQEAPRLAADCNTKSTSVGSRRSDIGFFLVTGGLSASFVVLIALLLLADIAFASFGQFANVISKPEILASVRLTLLSCSATTIMGLWVAVPLGYLLARFRFPGRWVIDTLVDIPIVLPPLVLGLSLLILFHLPFGHWNIGLAMKRDWQLPITGPPSCWPNSP